MPFDPRALQKTVMALAFQDELEKIAEFATKTNPGLWESAKREALGKMGGKHSARAMQLATQIYKKKGGGYRGPKPSTSTNSLKKWTAQKWKWSGGDKPGQGGRGVYLPENKVKRLKATAEGRRKLTVAAKKKSEATRSGEQYSSHGLAAGTSLQKRAQVDESREKTQAAIRRALNRLAKSQGVDPEKATPVKK